MNKKIGSVITVYQRTPANWMISHAVSATGVKEEHFETAADANAVIWGQKRRRGAVLIDEAIITSSNGLGTHLLNTCHDLGLLVIGVLSNEGRTITWGEGVPRSNLHLRLL